MRIFVTGGLGFIGSNFIIKQIHNNNEILNYDKITYAANQANLSKFSSSNLYTFVKGDITDANLLLNSINEFKPDYIINFAAESHVDRSIDGPKEFINTNILGTVELLEASLKFYSSLDSNKKNDSYDISYNKNWDFYENSLATR